MITCADPAWCTPFSMKGPPFNYIQTYPGWLTKNADCFNHSCPLFRKIIYPIDRASPSVSQKNWMVKQLSIKCLKTSQSSVRPQTSQCQSYQAVNFSLRFFHLQFWQKSIFKLLTPLMKFHGKSLPELFIQCVTQSPGPVVVTYYSHFSEVSYNVSNVSFFYGYTTWCKCMLSTLVHGNGLDHLPAGRCLSTRVLGDCCPSTLHLSDCNETYVFSQTMVYLCLLSFLGVCFWKDIAQYHQVFL